MFNHEKLTLFYKLLNNICKWYDINCLPRIFCKLTVKKHLTHSNDQLKTSLTFFSTQRWIKSFIRKTFACRHNFACFNSFQLHICGKSSWFLSKNKVWTRLLTSSLFLEKNTQTRHSRIILHCLEFYS